MDANTGRKTEETTTQEAKTSEERRAFYTGRSTALESEDEFVQGKGIKVLFVSASNNERDRRGNVNVVCACVCVYMCVCYLLPGQVCGTLHTIEENIRAVTKEKRTR